METAESHLSFGGTQGVYTHRSRVTGCDMTFALYTPPQAADGPCPMLWYLSGLTCTEETFMVKSGGAVSLVLRDEAGFQELASTTTDARISPPDSSTPTGTSATSRRLTARRNASSTRCCQSSKLSDRSSSRCSSGSACRHRRHDERDGRPQ